MGASKIQRNSIPQHLQDNDIKEFLSQLMKSGEEFRAMKLVVLGNGRIGKTTLLHTIKKILDESFDKVRIETI